MKKAISCAILLLPPVSAAALLLHCLETYAQVTHNESALLVQFYCLLGFLAVAVLWFINRKKGRAITGLALLSVLMLAGVYYVGGKIPFCVECDHVTAEELGFLIHWISPCDG